MPYGIGYVYRSTDAGAPVLDHNVGSLKNVLDAVLVTGYGSKLPMGWSKEFDAGDTVVYRQGAGKVKTYVRFQDIGFYAKVNMYSSMSDINNGTDGMPAPSEGPIACLLKKHLTTGAGVPWIIIGDAAGFWFLPNAYIHTNAGDVGYRLNYALQYIGAINSMNPHDVFNSVILTQWGSSVNTTSGATILINTGVTTPSTGFFGKFRGISQAKGWERMGIISCVSKHSSLLGVNITPGYIDGDTIPTKLNDTYLLASIRLFELINTRPTLIGNLPGFFDVVRNPYPSDYYGYSTNQPPFDIFTDSNGNQCFLLSLYADSTYINTSTPVCVIKAGEGFRNVY